MAAGLPRFVAIKHYNRDVYLSYKKNDDGLGLPVFEGDSVFDTPVKIEVEPSKSGGSDFHLRFCQSNRYLELGLDLYPTVYIFVAKAKQPEEDASKLSCTLFRSVTVPDNEGLYRLIHVNTGGWVDVWYPNLLSIYTGVDPEMYDVTHFYIRDWEALVKMPTRVAFKGDNGKYLEGVVVESHPYLRFSSDDPAGEASGHEVQLMGDGRLRIKSNHFNKFWRRSPNWIWAESGDATASDVETLFTAVKIDETTVALRNEGNSHFCSRLSADYKSDCLNAAVTSITNEAKLEVQELVMERKIYNVVYNMDDARIFDETPYIAGYAKLDNGTDDESSMDVAVTYQDERSYTFSRSVTLTAGVTVSVEAGLPFIEEATIEVSVEISGTLEWDDTKTTTTSVTATGSVTVPARSSAVVEYVGTKGTCNVPFSYRQQDKSSVDGKIVYTDLTDGIYNGVNCYNFDFKISKIDPIP